MKRMMILRGLFLAIVLASPAILRAASVDETYQFPPVAHPGEKVIISGSFDPAVQPSVSAKLYPLGSKEEKDAKDPKEINITSEKQVAITLPDNLPPGRYYVKLIYNGVTEQVPGELRVEANPVKPEPVKPEPVQVDAANPTTAYRNANGGFDFDIIGQNFDTRNLQSNRVYISGLGYIIKSWCNKKQECDNNPDQPCLWVESSEKLHVIGYKAARYQGPVTFRVDVGSTQSAEKKLTLSRYSETSVLIFSLGIYLTLAFIIYRLVARGMRDNLIDGKRYSPFWSFFLDKQSNTYSLSKFQLFAFFSVFVFGYLYVFLCRWLVQWQFVLPDVPSSISGILAISAGTTLVAAGATAARGSKGAGMIQPSAADFITSGGQVIPERFQFFVWTLVACFGFLALLLSQDPATIEKFPAFPDGLLYVMGVSATGYLGGKLVRSAGPVIRNIALENVDSAGSIITIQGENLSKEGDFFIDGKKLPIVPDTRTQLETAAGTKLVTEAGPDLVTGTPQDQASDRSFCTELKITVHKAAEIDLTTGDHEFRIMNKDGQFADIRFTAILPSIKAVLPVEKAGDPDNKVIPQGKGEIKIIVKGSGFRAGTTVRWTPASASAPIELVSSAVEFADAENLKITLVPGDPGTGTLVLVTPNGFSATATVTVV